MFEKMLLRRSKVFISDMQLLIAATAFSCSFILQRAAMVNGLSPFIFNASRFGLSAMAFAVVSPTFPDSLKSVKSIGPDSSVGVTAKYDKQNFSTWRWGLILGFLNFFGTTFQQWGIALTSASKCAFMTGFYVFFVPVIHSLIVTYSNTSLSSQNRSLICTVNSLKTWVAVSLSLIGLFLLSGASIQDMTIGRGEALTLIGTLFWTAHVLFTDQAMNYVDTVSITLFQLTTVSILSLIFSFFTEYSYWSIFNIIRDMHWIIALSLTEASGFFLSAIGQRFSPPSHVAFIFSLESVFTSIGGYFFLNERLTSRDFLGCFLIICSTIFSQLCIPLNASHNNNNNNNNNSSSISSTNNNNNNIINDMDDTKHDGLDDKILDKSYANNPLSAIITSGLASDNSSFSMVKRKSKSETFLGFSLNGLIGNGYSDDLQA